MKKLLPILSIVATLIGVLTWLEWRGSQRAVQDGPPPSVPVDATDRPGETLALTWMGPPHFPSGREGLWVETMLEQRFNLEIRPLFLDPSAYERKKPLMLSGGAIPEVFIESDPLMLRKAVHHRFVTEVPYALIARLAPAYFARLNENSSYGWLFSRVDGRNYGLPALNGSLRPVPGLWRADWLAQVGITKTPETLDEMFEALRRFTFDDPDGNGIQDTWGMTGDVNNWWWVSFSEIFGAYGVIPFDWMEVDGQVVWGGLRPETKAALGTLRDWYAAGVIHPDFVTDSAHPGQSMDRKFLQGQTGYVFYKGLYGNLRLDEPASFHRQLLDLQFPEEVRQGLAERIHLGEAPPVLIPAHFPIGPGGQRGARVWGMVGNVAVFGRPVADRPEVAARVLTMLEQIGTDRTLYVESMAGREGEHWTWRDPAVGVGSGLQLVDELRQRNAAWRQVLGYGSGYWNLLGNVKEHNDYFSERASREFDDQWRLEQWGLVNVLGKSDVVPSASLYLGDLRVLQQTVFAEIIRGRRPLESFDTFVAEWRQRGGDLLITEANAMWAEQRAIQAELRAVSP